MKRIAFIALVLILFAVPTVNAQFRHAAMVGVNINSLNFKQDIAPVGHTVGAQAGIISELMFPGIGFGMDLGFFYNQRGASVDLGEKKIWAVDGFGKENLMIHTLTIPLHLRFKWTRMNGLEEYFAPLVYGGPDFNINVAHSGVSSDLQGIDNPFKYAAADLSLTCGGGFEFFKRWQLTVQYSWGMTYVAKTRKLDNYSCRTGQWDVRVCYFF